MWLDLAHQKLDQAVFDAYGWPHDLSDEEILTRRPCQNGGYAFNDVINHLRYNKSARHMTSTAASTA